MESFDESSFDESSFGESSFGESSFGENLFGFMESFGSSGSNIFIILLLIVLVVTGYLIYKNRDKIKMPSLPQRIAQFGRQIKSIKKM